MKRVQNINEIWGSLKKACSDPKMMLSKIVSQLVNVEMIWRMKSPVKIAEGLTKIIKDLIQLSHRQNTEDKSYNNDAIDKIYKITGGGRVIKFLMNIYDEDLEEVIHWKRLIEFLEKDLNIQQQKTIMNENTKPRESGQQDRMQKKTHIHHYQGKQHTSSDLSCHIGPGESKLIQYFACKEFEDLNPFDRFQLIEKKDFICNIFSQILKSMISNDQMGRVKEIMHVSILHMTGFLQRNMC